MLPKHQRLANNRIEYVLKKGRKKGNHFFVMKYVTTSRAKSRFCIMTSVKISSKAVERNRLRRQIYEIFRLNPLLPVTPVDLVMIVKPPLIKLNFAELTKTVLINLKNLTNVPY